MASNISLGSLGKQGSVDSMTSGGASPRYPSGSVKVLNDRYCHCLAAAADADGITRCVFLPNPLIGSDYGSFNSFAQSEHLVPFFRSLLCAVGEELDLADYHLRLWPIMQRSGYGGLPFDGPTEAAAQAAGFFIELFVDTKRTGQPPAMVSEMLRAAQAH